MIALDTHALLWWALDPDQLSQTAKRTLSEMETSGGVVSSISIWELGVKVKRGHLDIGMSIDEFARRIEHSGTVTVIPVDTTVWLRSLALPWEHRDPADRVIVATALLHSVPLLTKDHAIHAFDGVRCVW